MSPATSIPSKEQLLPLLREFFRNEECVELAYLFGSVAEGKATALSDIDIGVYMSENLTNTERFRKQLELTSKLVGLLGNNNIDLLVLNDTAPVLSFEIIEPNVLIFERDHGLKIDVEQRIMSGYLDRKYHEDLMNRMFLERVREKGLT